MAHENTPLQEIGILGSGFVGITLAAHFAGMQKSRVIIVDNNIEKVKKIENGNYGVWEPELDEILNLAIENGTCEVRSQFEDNSLDVLFITVGTPLVNNEVQVGHPELIEAIKHNINALRQKSLIFLRSTVTIGTTDRIKVVIDGLGRSDLSVYFAPERTAEGVALEELRKLPQILGGARECNFEIAIAFLKSQNFDVILTETASSAELIKLACNSWRDLTFAFANEIAFISAQEGIDGRNAINLANQNYARSKIPMPGPSGGPCLTKDSYILTAPYSELKESSSVIVAARKTNELVYYNILQKTQNEINKRKSPQVVIAGIAFKGSPRTNDTRNGLGRYLVENLLLIDSLPEIKIWDPYVEDDLLIGGKELSNITFDGETTDILIICNNASYFYDDFFVTEISKMSENSIIIDCWNMINASNLLSARKITFGSGEWNSNG